MKQLLRKYEWQDGKSLTLGQRTMVMGILNVTTDSFSDGGKWNSLDKALFHAEEMIKDGADLIDIGAESSHPGFVPVSADAEMERLLPFLEHVVKEIPVPVSVDTFKASTAEAAVHLGVNLLNDIWGLQYEPEAGKMAAVAAKYKVPVIAMHNQEGTIYKNDIIREMECFFANTVKIARTAGVAEKHIILDPGIGFGKTAEQNKIVLNRLEELTCLEYPMLLGTSRKGFIGQTLNLPVNERMEGTGATCVIGIMKGCSILRVHDVKPIVRMCRMTDAVLQV